MGADTYHDIQLACAVGVMRAVSTPWHCPIHTIFLTLFPVWRKEISSILPVLNIMVFSAEGDVSTLVCLPRSCWGAINQQVSSTLNDLGQECVPETYRLLHHLRGYDGRAGDHTHTSRTRMTTCASSNRRQRVTVQHAPAMLLDFRWFRTRKYLAVRQEGDRET